MADYDWAQDSGSTKTSGSDGSPDDSKHSKTDFGATADVFDGDMATEKYIREILGTSSNGWISLWAESDFTSARNINTIICKIGSTIDAGSVTSRTYSISAYYSGGWNVVGSGTIPASQTFTYSDLGLVGVTKVKVELYMGVSTNSVTTSTFTIRAYELQAWGPKYYDSGLRVRTSGGVVAVGGEDLTASHKLRIIKGSTVFGIPLVETTDANACGLRIITSSGVKSLTKAS